MKKLTFIALLAIATLSACKKDKEQNPEYVSASEFKAKYSVPAQSFNETAGTAFSITGEKGIKLNFPANAFLDGSGNQVSGAIKLTLKEVLSKKDILLSGKMTESNGQLLVSGGEFQILATKNGQALKLNPAAEIITRVPKTLSSEPMDLFLFAPGIAGDSTWTQVQKRTQGTPEYYEFALPGFGWVNCDYFYSDARPKTTITVSPTFTGASPSIKDQSVYLIFDELNTVIGLPFNIDLNKHQSYLNSMPIGLTAKLAVIAVDVHDRIYFGETSLTISAGLHLDVPVSLANQTVLDNYLNSLD